MKLDIQKIIAIVMVIAGLGGTWKLNDYRITQNAEAATELKAKVDNAIIEGQKANAARDVKIGKIEAHAETTREDVKEIKQMIQKMIREKVI